MAPFNVRSKVCIGPIYVRSKICKFALHMYRSNADFAPHMEGRHADFAPHMERRHSSRDPKIAKTAILANFQRELFKTTNILGVYMTYVTTFEIKNIFWESTLKYRNETLPRSNKEERERRARTKDHLVIPV